MTRRCASGRSRAPARPRSPRCRRRSIRSRSRATARSSRAAPTARSISCRRRRDARRDRGTAGADHLGRGVGRRRAGRGRRHPRLGRGDRRAGRTLARTLVGPGLPVWSVAFLPDNRTMITGGTDRTVRRWNAVTGEHVGAVAMGVPDDPLAAFAGDPGAEVFRACVACHTLSARRRQPRRPDARRHLRPQDRDAAGLQFLRGAQEARHRVEPGDGGEAVRDRPAAYTPGTKMPEQQIGSPEDRAALVQFLEKATKPN